MAKEEPKKEVAKKEEKKGKKSGKAGMIAFIVLFAFATPFTLPTVIMLLLGMIPTYVAFATDSDKQKSGAIAVSYMNFAGIVPFIIDLWSKGQTLENSLQIMTSSNTWIVILGAAAVGQLIVHTIPQAIATLSLAQADARVKVLRKNMEMLKEAWGPDVATTKSVDKNR